MSKTTANLLLLCFLFVTFTISRIIFLNCGIIFDSSSLGEYWQFLDPEILKNHLMRGLWNLHTQPPAFNLFLGAILKIFPNSWEFTFQCLYLAMGFIIYCCLYYFLRKEHFSIFLSYTLSTLFIISPNSILFENWLFYTYPVSMLLLIATICLQKYQNTTKHKYAGFFLFSLALICLTRSAYHLIFILPCAIFICFSNRRAKKALLLYSTIAISTVLFFFLKNYFIFGFFGTSSWTGMSMFRVASHSLGKKFISELVETQKIPEVSKISSFSPIEEYSPDFINNLKQNNVPELFNSKKSNDATNYNHYGYIKISKDYESASKYILINHTSRYLSGSFSAWLKYLRPSWRNTFLEQNIKAISPYISFLNSIRGKQTTNLQNISKKLFNVRGPKYPYPIANLIYLPAILIFCLFTLTTKTRSIILGDRSNLVTLFLSFTILYLAIIGNFVECGENNRFRVETDPLIYLMSIILFRQIYLKLSKLITKARE